MLSSTLRTAEARCYCGKYLTQTEHYFYVNRCTECVHQDFLKKWRERKDDKN